MNKFLIFTVLFYLVSCSTNDSKKNQKDSSLILQKEIELNKKKELFLGFYWGMPKELYFEKKNDLIEKGNLDRHGFYMFYYSEQDSLSFSINPDFNDEKLANISLSTYRYSCTSAHQEDITPLDVKNRLRAKDSGKRRKKSLPQKRIYYDFQKEYLNKIEKSRLKILNFFKERSWDLYSKREEKNGQSWYTLYKANRKLSIINSAFSKRSIRHDTIIKGYNPEIRYCAELTLKFESESLENFKRKRDSIKFEELEQIKKDKEKRVKNYQRTKDDF